MVSFTVEYYVRPSKNAFFSSSDVGVVYDLIADSLNLEYPHFGLTYKQTEVEQ